MHLPFRYAILFPPQSPLVWQGDLQFFGTLTLDGISPAEFRLKASKAECHVKFGFSTGTTDALPMNGGTAELSHSFGASDVTLIVSVPVKQIAQDRTYMLIADCIGRDDGSTERWTPNAYCLALRRTEDGWE